MVLVVLVVLVVCMGASNLIMGGGGRGIPSRTLTGGWVPAQRRKGAWGGAGWVWVEVGWLKSQCQRPGKKFPTPQYVP